MLDRQASTALLGNWPCSMPRRA